MCEHCKRDENCPAHFAVERPLAPSRSPFFTHYFFRASNRCFCVETFNFAVLRISLFPEAFRQDSEGSTAPEAYQDETCLLILGGKFRVALEID